MNESSISSKEDYEANAIAILKSPQANTSITKFAGPYINSLIQEDLATQHTDSE